MQVTSAIDAGVAPVVLPEEEAPDVCSLEPRRDHDDTVPKGEITSVANGVRELVHALEDENFAVGDIAPNADSVAARHTISNAPPVSGAVYCAFARE